MTRAEPPSPQESASKGPRPPDPWDTGKDRKLGTGEPHSRPQEPDPTGATGEGTGPKGSKPSVSLWPQAPIPRRLRHPDILIAAFPEGLDDVSYISPF